MRKSLILSVIMALVLVLALTSATYAWYMANSSASAGGMSLNASTAAGNVKIGHTAETISHTSITWVAGTGIETPVDDTSTAAQKSVPAVPMMPTNATLTAWATAVKDGDNKIDYTTGATPVTYSFFLSNEDSDAITVSIKGETSGALTNQYEWAIVQGSTVVSNSAFDYLTATTDGVTEDATAEVLAKTGTYNLTAGVQSVEFTVYVWFAGDQMVNSLGGKGASLDISVTLAQQQGV